MRRARHVVAWPYDAVSICLNAVKVSSRFLLFLSPVRSPKQTGGHCFADRELCVRVKPWCAHLPGLPTSARTAPRQPSCLPAWLARLLPELSSAPSAGRQSAPRVLATRFHPDPTCATLRTAKLSIPLTITSAVARQGDALRSQCDAGRQTGERITPAPRPLPRAT